MKPNIKATSILFLIGMFSVFAIMWIVIGTSVFDIKQKDKTRTPNMFKSITTNLIVKDVNQTIDYYNKLFGFKKFEVVPDSGSFDFAIIRKDGIKLMLQKRESLSDDILHLKDEPIGGSFTLFITVRDIDEIYNHVRDKVEILVNLKTTSYGMKQFTLKDLNGYVLTLAEEINK